jgi:hypothetical protein
MSFLSRIDWFNHDGVNLGMINDFMRNQFYDRVLSRYVAGQRCTDIGFGTGLLSMLALKHGAEHVRAFESDADRYLLGCEIVQRLGLGNKIDLINERYDNVYTTTPITFTETVNGNLWWEGLWNSLPSDEKSVFLPGEYFLEIWALAVPTAFAQGIGIEEQTNRVFAPGVDVDPQFVATVNELICETADCIYQPMNLADLSSGIVQFDRQVGTVWNWVPYMRAVQAGKMVASYVAQYHDDRDHFELNIPTGLWRNSTVLIVPRMGMQQDTDRLYLDTGHWGPGENPVLLVNPQGYLRVNHNVRNGLITYSME